MRWPMCRIQTMHVYSLSFRRLATGRLVYDEGIGRKLLGQANRFAFARLQYSQRGIGYMPGADNLVMRGVVMRVVAPRQGKQHVDIGQCNQKPSSSRH